MKALRRGCDVTMGRIGTKEIDFACREQKRCIRFTCLLASEETVRREFCVSDSVPDNFPKFAVCQDEFDMSGSGVRCGKIRKCRKKGIPFPDYQPYRPLRIKLGAGIAVSARSFCPNPAYTGVEDRTVPMRTSFR